MAVIVGCGVEVGVLVTVGRGVEVDVLVEVGTRVRVSVGVDENGQPKIDVVSADFGPLPAPKGLTETISAMIREAYTGSLGPVATGLRIENISIANGIMTISGRIK